MHMTLLLGERNTLPSGPVIAQDITLVTALASAVAASLKSSTPESIKSSSVLSSASTAEFQELKDSQEKLMKDKELLVIENTRLAVTLDFSKADAVASKDSATQMVHAPSRIEPIHSTSPPAPPHHHRHHSPIHLPFKYANS